MQGVIPQDDKERKDAPMYRGLLGYFPAALFRVAAHSLTSDRKHNPGAADGPTWSRDKSTDHADCIVRHLTEAHTDPDYHLVALAWRALALLQEHEERKGLAPGASSRQPAVPGVVAEATLAAAEKGEKWIVECQIGGDRLRSWSARDWLRSWSAWEEYTETEARQHAERLELTSITGLRYRVRRLP